MVQQGISLQLFYFKLNWKKINKGLRKKITKATKKDFKLQKPQAYYFLPQKSRGRENGMKPGLLMRRSQYGNSFAIEFEGIYQISVW